MQYCFLILVAAVALAGCGPTADRGNRTETGQDAAPPAAAADRMAGLTPEAVRAMVERDGATRTVQSLDADGDSGNPFDHLLEGIASGEQRWLALVPRIAPGVDAGTATGLEIAIAEALPRNARGVLRLGGHGWSVEDSCAYPMIEPSPNQMRAYFASAIPAVQAVADPSLQESKALCLGKLREAQHNLGG